MNEFLLLAFLFLVAGVISVPIASRLGLGSVLGYLIAGVAISPLLQMLKVDVVSIQHFAEFGVVMMLFLVGLELEPRMLWSMRSKLLGLRVPPGFRRAAPPDPSVVAPLRTAPPPLNLPAVWDWRDEGGVTPVKHQGQCGSCWIFCAVGAFESTLLIETGVEHDLSEQQILVCNNDNEGCDGG